MFDWLKVNQGRMHVFYWSDQNNKQKKKLAKGKIVTFLACHAMDKDPLRWLFHCTRYDQQIEVLWWIK